MQPCQCLQQDHPKSDPLQGIQHAEPQPQTARDEGACGVAAACPGEVEAGARDAPPDLGPAGGAEAAGEDGEDPTVGFGEVAEEEEGESPDYAEEDDD